MSNYIDWDEMRYEAARLATFKGWTCTFQTPESMASAALFFSGRKDFVFCPYCAGCLGHWEPGDDPMSEHKRIFGWCPFVNGIPVGNIPINKGEDVCGIGRPTRLTEESQLVRALDLCSLQPTLRRLKDV